MIATLLIVAAALIFPFSLLGDLSGFRPPPFSFLLVMAIIVVLYVIVGEVVKRSFYRLAEF